MRNFDRLIACLKRLPGIGPKQAERMAAYLLRAPASEAEALAEAVRAAKANVRNCRTCLDFTEEEECRICADPGRDASQLCVVEQPADVAALERSRGFRGLYHVLHGRIAPLYGIGPDGIKVKELVSRVRGPGPVREVILATDPDTEGEATALYLASILRDLGPRITRIAQGVPMGAHLDYLDERTLSCALTSRREFRGSDEIREHT